ncbi:helix-turn-helix transcriptional regulator, partial [uncultured Rubinisphaera sp.]|uniref:helix-turn-helix domain-containing protein n=1 Tax=uncultured Rubinisphaera sp. TaxID=1678686 RepID=UPI0030DC468B
CKRRHGVAEEDIRIRFGNRLRAVRNQAGISQEKLGELAGLHRTFISMVERGERNVTIATVEKLACALDCGLYHLMPDAVEKL